MGLITGLLIGIAFGIGLVAGWNRKISSRSAARIAKTIEIKLLSSLDRDDLKRICGDNCPEWISFPVFEQVKWLNKQLSKMWPYIADATEVVIRDSVEPILEEYCPPGISSLKFSKLSLGNVPPKIEGTREAEESRLKDLQVFTTIRVIFQLSEDLPCISAVVVALLSEPKPRIDYILKAIGGSLTALPGLSDMIDDTVNSIITDMLQWPHRIIVPIGGIPVDTSELELKPQGRVSVIVVKANNLKNMEMIGKSDPYVVLHIRPLFKVQTRVVDDNLNPVWNETFQLIAEDKETQSIFFEVFDKDITQDKKLGIAKLPLNDLEPETSKEFLLRLLPSLDTLKVKDKKDRGTITIKVLYHIFNKKEQQAALEEEKRLIEDKKQLRDSGVVGSTVDVVDGAASLVGSGMGAVGSGIGAGAGAVGSGIGSGVGLVGSGLGAVGSGLSKAGKFMGKTVAGQFGSSRRTPSNSSVDKLPS